MKKFFIASVCLLVSALSMAEENWEAYAHLPIIEQPQVSPDGQRIAMLYNSPDGPTVALAPFGSRDFTNVAGLKKNRDRLDFIRWSGNKFLVIGVSYPDYYQGEHFRVRRLYSVNVNDMSSRMLTTRAFSRNSWYQYQSLRLISSLKNDEDHALVATYDDKDRAYSVYKVNLQDSSFDKIQRNGEEISHWEADQNGVIRIGIQNEKKGNQFFRHIWYREKAGDELKNIHTQAIGNDNTFDIIGLNEDGKKAYVLSDRETGYGALWLYDIASGEFESLLFQADGYDLDGGLENSQGELIGVDYYDDFYRTHYFDPADGAQENTLKQLIKGREVTITSRSADKQRVLALASSDHEVPTYFWLDLATNKGAPWIAAYPYLLKKQFANVENIQFSASDGLKISGYLTMPSSVDKPKLIVRPHGGPHARDYKYFDPMNQYLASLGYAVLQINFRGSSGFGSNFEVAGYYEYGKRMQQDVYDGMDWLIETGRVSPDRACAVGASYGGYWALTAAFQQPDRFDCIVSISGISDLEDMVVDRERRDYFNGNIVHDDSDENLEEEIDALAEVSAINHIDQIKAPVLLMHGLNDTRVSYRQSKEFYSKAKGRKDVSYIEIKDGTHFFDDAEAQKTLFKNVGEFLQKHL